MTFVNNDRRRRNRIRSEIPNTTIGKYTALERHAHIVSCLIFNLQPCEIFRIKTVWRRINRILLGKRAERGLVKSIRYNIVLLACNYNTSPMSVVYNSDRGIVQFLKSIVQMHAYYVLKFGEGSLRQCTAWKRTVNVSRLLIRIIEWNWAAKKQGNKKNTFIKSPLKLGSAGQGRQL